MIFFLFLLAFFLFLFMIDFLSSFVGVIVVHSPPPL